MFKDSSAVGQRMLCEVECLLRIYLTIPVTTAMAEGTFSVLRRLKSYLRGTMVRKCLNNPLLLHVYKDRTDRLDLREVGQQFVGANKRQKNFFGCMFRPCTVTGHMNAFIQVYKLYSLID